MQNWIVRQREIDEIYALLSDGQHVLLEGLGGTGKTVLARQIAEKFAGRAQRPATWIYAGAPEVSSTFLEELREAPQGHLVIIDGIDETRDLGRKLAIDIMGGLLRRNYLSVLVTSRMDPGLTGFSRVHLESMSRDDIEAYLANISRSAERAPQELLNLLDGNRLATELVAAMVKQGDASFSSILSLLRDFRRPGVIPLVQIPAPIESNAECLERPRRGPVDQRFRLRPSWRGGTVG